VDVQFNYPLQILRVTGDDPRTQLLETLASVGRILVEAARRIDAVADVEVNAKRLAVDGLD